MKKILIPLKKVLYDLDIFSGKLLLQQCSGWKLPIFGIIPYKGIHTSDTLVPGVFLCLNNSIPKPWISIQ